MSAESNSVIPASRHRSTTRVASFTPLAPQALNTGASPNVAVPKLSTGTLRSERPSCLSSMDARIGQTTPTAIPGSCSGLLPGARCTEGLHPVDLAAPPPAGHADTNVLEPGIHDVRAMTRACEPAGNNFFRRLGAKCDVLAGEARLIAGTNHAILGLTAVVTAMIKVL